MTYTAPCPNCGTSCFIDEIDCPQCGWALLHSPSTERVVPRDSGLSPTYRKAMERKRMLGLLGSVTLFIGVFAPIISLPIVGNMNYFQNGRGDGVIIIMLAIVSLVLTLTKKYGGLWLTGLMSLGLMLLTFVNFHLKISEAKAQMERELSGNLFSGLGAVALQSVQIQWGWAVLVVGAVLLIASAAIRKPSIYHRAG